MTEDQKTHLQPAAGTGPGASANVPRTRLPTQRLADLPIGVPGRRRQFTGLFFARCIYHMLRYLCLQRVAPDFDGQIDVVELRVTVPALDLHIATLGVMQAHQTTDAWYVRVTRPQEDVVWPEWPTLLLACEPRVNFPLEMEVPGPASFEDGSWLDDLWRWFQFQFAAQKDHFDALVAERVPPAQPATQVVAVPTAAAAPLEQHSAALHQQLQEVLHEMQEMSYADLHPMEAAVQALMEDATRAKDQRKAVQRQIVALHAVAVPAFGAAMQGVVTSDDEQWEKTRHWLLIMSGVPAALGEAEVSGVMQEASATALRSFRDDLPAAEVGERYALTYARKICAMAPGGHVFLTKDRMPRLCHRCGLPWQEGQPLLSERPRVHSTQLVGTPGPREPKASAFLT